MIRYAVVGVRGYAGLHVNNIRTHAAELDCELVAVTIRPKRRRPEEIQEFTAAGVEIFDDAVDMFDRLAGKVDAVVIPTGIFTHCQLLCAAVGHGYHVYLEKPPAATVQEVDAMLAAVADSGRICGLGFQMISSQSINAIKRRIVAGELGQVRRLRCWAMWPRNDAYYARTGWAGRRKIDDTWVLDGPSNNALAHQIANMLYLASPVPRTFAAPRAVRAQLYHARDIDGEDTAAMEIQTAEGPVAYFIVSHCTEGQAAGPWIEIECSQGSIRWQRSGQTTITYADGRSQPLQVDEPDPRLEALKNFNQAIRTGDAALVDCDLAMGRNFTLAINGAWESSAASHAIDPKYIRREGSGDEARTVIDGINDAIARCGAEGKLFSDIGCEWAVKTEPFDLTGYTHFPREFEP